MPRDIPVGNGDMLVTFDEFYRARDIYWPYVGRYNHTAGQVQRFGVWVDGVIAWVEDPGWKRTLAYEPDTLVTSVTLVHEEWGIEVRCNDAVDFHEAVWLRRITVKDLAHRPRDVRVFMHFDLSIEENPVGDTANYDPDTGGLILYKGENYFLVNACDQSTCGIDCWAIGSKRIGGSEGTWRDAEDGELGRNAISQGSVDATIRLSLPVEAGGETSGAVWLACGHNHEDIRRISTMIRERRPEKYLSRTGAYWRLWVSKEETDTSHLPPAVREAFVRSQLVMRTQIDNRGAVIAANDSDITHFAGDHYSYCWPRDGSLVAYALVLSGQSELSRAFFRYCGKVIHAKGYFLHKYTPEGRLASSWHPWVLEGRPVLPVQQDETALVVWALRKHFETFKDVEFVKPLYNSLVVNPAKWMVEWRDTYEGKLGLPKPSWDLWEERRGVHTFTLAAVIAGLRAAAAFATDFGDERRAAYWQNAAEEILAALKRVAWNEETKSFARMVRPAYAADGTVSAYERDMTRDSANYALFALGALAADDPMVVSDMRSITERLTCKTPIGGAARYENDYYHQVEKQDVGAVPGNPWLICTLWQAQHIIAKAKSLEELKAAVPILEWAAARQLASGVLAEQFHPHTGTPISVSPLTWSHATVVIVVKEYLNAYERLSTGTLVGLHGLGPGSNGQEETVGAAGVKPAG